MRKLLTPTLVLGFLTGLLFLTGCPTPPCEDESFVGCGEHGTCVEVDGKASCKCDEGWGGDFCETDLNIVEFPKGNLDIIVKRKSTGKASNNYGCLAVLGRTKEEMYFIEYQYSKLGIFDKQKYNLKGYNDLVDKKAVIDTAYSMKGATDPADGSKVGMISFKDIDEGTYYLHVFDGNQDKYVSQVTITSAEGDDLIYALVEPLGKLKVTVAQSSIADTELDSNVFMVWGPSTDTLDKVLVKDYESIPLEPLFEGRTGTIINENGKPEKGTYFLIDIPTRNYLVVGYNSQFGNKDGAQAYGYVRVRRNILSKVRVSFKN